MFPRGENPKEHSRFTFDLYKHVPMCVHARMRACTCMHSWIINREARVRDTEVPPQDGVWVTPAWMAKTL